MILPITEKKKRTPKKQTRKELSTHLSNDKQMLNIEKKRSANFSF